MAFGGATFLFSMLLLALYAAPLRSQDKKDDKQSEPVYDLGPGITPPRVTKQVAPKHSMGDGVRVTGSVVIVLVVSSEGLPKDVRVVKGIDKELDQSAIDAVEQWRFAPGEKDGKPVAVRLSLELDFHGM